jgi:hypothetical protein
MLKKSSAQNPLRDTAVTHTNMLRMITRAGSARSNIAVMLLGLELILGFMFDAPVLAAYRLGRDIVIDRATAG